MNLQHRITVSDLSTIGPRLTPLHACVCHYTVLYVGCVPLSLWTSSENRKLFAPGPSSVLYLRTAVRNMKSE
jgi:hypothetical protein